MKKLLYIFIIFGLIVCIKPVFADVLDDFGDLDHAWDGQKTITNKEFEQVMDALQEKTKKKEVKCRTNYRN